MNLNEIEAKCFIMALFIRDDGLRFLLGSGAYEFKDGQLMFAGNTIENDVVSVQGNDGYMLAGQVRRPSTQVFDGYIGDASVSKSEVEGYRRDFMAFFQKNHFYTVVYVMADGSAIQRRRGFLVDAPTSQELWQMYPEYHVALNFEDVNYYKYSENDDGEETYAKSADIGLAKVQYGGLIWDNDSEIEISGTGTNITLAGTMEGGAIESVELNGDTEQTTYSGKNLAKLTDCNLSDTGYSLKISDGEVTITSVSRNNWLDLGAGVRNGSWIPNYDASSVSDNHLTAADSGTYTLSLQSFQLSVTGSQNLYFSVFTSTREMRVTISPTSTSFSPYTFTLGTGEYVKTLSIWTGDGNSAVSGKFKVQLEKGSQATSFEPYVGGTASPNPDYPQEVQTVTGRQVVTISDGDSQSQEYEINLGKNLCNPSDIESVFVYASFNRAAYGAGDTSVIIPVLPNTDYTISTLVTQARYRGGFSDSIPVPGGGDITVYNGFNKDSQLVSVTTNSGDHKYLIVNATDLTKIQIERGSTATTYAPYFTPIELCKIGDYQDYIYKSGDNWYVKKGIGKMILDGTETITKPSTNIFVVENLSGDWLKKSETVFYYCEDYYGLKAVESNSQFNTLAAQYNYAFDFTSGQNGKNIRFKDTRYDNIDNYKTWLASNNVAVYYALATPTDTQITNEALISELEDLLSATTYSGTTYITVSGDLASPLEIKVITIGGGGVVWDENGAEWEAGGGGEIVIVNVDSIENILPVWTIRGEAENPTLTNLTTGMSITYNGTVASGQTLVIDLLNKTAKLNGTSVISDVSGQWVEFKPGNNRVSYSTENANAPDSTIEWQEVVG